MPRTTQKLRSGEDSAQKNGHTISSSKSSGSGSARRPRQRRGRLQSFLNMPLDVIIEVLSHLEPLDLLHLARTTKMLRGMLMNRRNAFLWKMARANIPGAPDCPDLVAEPAYANVLFNTRCNMCGKPNTKNVIWDMKLRYCKVCHSRLMMHSSGWYGGSASEAALQEVLKPVQLEHSVQMYSIFAVCPVIAEPLSAQPYVTGIHCILHSVVLELQAKLESMSLVERTVYISKQMASNVQWRNTIASLEDYLATKSQARSTQLADMRKARYDSIVTRLTALGWGPELETMSYTEQHALRRVAVVAESRPLTERAWQKGLPALEELMATYRERRLTHERQVILEERLALFAQVLKGAYDHGEWPPSALEIAQHMPAVREAIDVPVDITVGKQELSAICESGAVLAFAAAWREQKAAELRTLLGTKAGVLDPDVDAASLAVGRFMCKVCLKELLSSQVLSHWCSPGNFSRHHEMSVMPEGYPLAAMLVFSNSPRSMLEHIVPVRVVETADVLRLCGYDPRSVTLDTMDNSPVRLGCKRCGPDVAAMTWAAALRKEHLGSGLSCTVSHLYVLDESKRKQPRSSS